MKNLKVLLILAISGLFIFNSCNKDEEEGYKYNFIDQELSGKIAGEDWTYKSGGASDNNYFDTSSLYNAKVFDNDTIEPCGYLIGSKSLLFFFPMETGTYDITDYPVTFFAEGEETENLVTLIGAFEILTIDTAIKQITGRMDAKYDDDNFVNGNFNLTICY